MPSFCVILAKSETHFPCLNQKFPLAVREDLENFMEFHMAAVWSQEIIRRIVFSSQECPE